MSSTARHGRHHDVGAPGPARLGGLPSGPPSRGVRNGVVGCVLGGSHAGEPGALVAQRTRPDPAQVTAASGHATRSHGAAQFLAAIRHLPPVGMSAAILRAMAAAGLPIGVDGAGSPVVAHMIPGRVADVALVVAGVHGSEQSGVEVAENLLTQLMNHQPHFTVVVVPRLFPSSVASREAWEQQLAATQSGITRARYSQLREAAGDIGRTTPGQVDPNRQFPELGTDLDLSKPLDAKGRIIEPSNLALLALIDAFKPSRIVSVHAIKNLARAGIYADPHPSVAANKNDPRAKESDALALTMAKEAKRLGVNVRGNERRRSWTSLYPGQDARQSSGQMAKENAAGRSLGQWGPSRGISVITVEVGEQYRSGSAVADPNRKVELEAHATVIREIFLGPPAATSSAVPAGAIPAPVQRTILGAVGCGAGNRSAASLASRLASSSAAPGVAMTRSPRRLVG